MDVLSAAIHEPRFPLHLAVTTGEAAVGFVAGNLLAALAALAFLRWSAAEKALMPYAIALKTTPIVAIAPILLLWLGGGWISKASAAGLVCFFPMLVNMTRGLRIVDAPEHREYRDLFATWRVSWWATVTNLRLPFAMPLVFSALKVSASLAMVGAIVAEFIAADRGIGYLIVIYSRRLETASMFAAIFASTLLSVAWFYLIVFVERRYARHFGQLSNSETE
jgi:NitT/TauT family transport system permease protein